MMNDQFENYGGLKHGDIVTLDPEMVDPKMDWTETAIVWRPLYSKSDLAYKGADEKTTHIVGIRFPTQDYGNGNPGNCHMVANNRIHLLDDDLNEEVEAAIQSIKESAHGH